MPDPQDAAEAGVLPPFVEDWIERARKAQEAVDRILAEQALRVPRIERWQDHGGQEGYTLVRSDRGHRNADGIWIGPERATTVNFTPAEWALLTQSILAAHGLRAVDE